MKKIWNDPIYKSVIVLTAICLVVSALLAVTNLATAPVIERTQKQAVEQAMQEVMPTKTGFEEITDSLKTLPETVQSVYREKGDAGYVVSLATRSQYSSADMLVTVGIGKDGAVCGIRITNYAESKDFGAQYPQQYLGATAQTVQAVDSVAGVTYSSAALNGAVKDALTAVQEVQ